MACSGMLHRVALLRSVRRLLVTFSVVPSSPILVTMMKVLNSSETSVFTRATRRNIPEDAILDSQSRENLKSYLATTAFRREQRHVNKSQNATIPCVWIKLPCLYSLHTPHLTTKLLCQ
jgi:hypothetical protein